MSSAPLTDLIHLREAAALLSSGLLPFQPEVGSDAKYPVQSSDASEDCASDDNLIPRGKCLSISSVLCNLISLSHHLWLSSPCACSCSATGQHNLAHRPAIKKHSTFREAP